MIPFKDIELQDKELITSFTLNSPRRNCDLSFSNLCSWRFLYNTKFAIMDGFLLLKFWADGELVYMMPIGNGDLNKVLDALIEDANREGEPFCLLGICAGMCSELETFMPGRFQFTADRDYADYVYLRSDLATLSGKKFQAKRNHINKFKSLFEDRWSYESMTKDNLEECFQMALKWRAENQDTFGVHVEKADTRIDGAYAMINYEFANHIPEQYIYINREEDLGIEGLRKAKLSYQPAIILEKYVACLKEQPVEAIKW